MNKRDVLRIIEEYNLAPHKQFGQNFLIDDSIIIKIIDSCNVDGKRVLEIGPGLGAISRGLIEGASFYAAVEIDSGFFRYLTDFFLNRDNVKIIHSDFLRVEIEYDFDVVVSNLPYYCASEILFKLATQFRAPHIYVMVQKEMGDRMGARCGTANYGAMSVTLSYYFDIKHLFYVSGDSFFPRPDVKSSFLKLSRKDRKLDEYTENLFHLIVKSAFWGRRKTILKALSDSPHISYDRAFIKQMLELCKIDSSIRGENLGLAEFLQLTEAIKNNEK